MAKDYKKEPRKEQPARTPGSWMSFLTGLGIGLACAALTWFWFQQPAQIPASTLPSVELPTAPVPTEQPAAQEPPPPPETPVTRPTFDFYTILPEIEVKIPDSEVPVAEESAAPPTEQKPSEPSQSAGSYVLQVASFQSREDAEQSKAMLALQGVQANIHQVGINGQNWFRVHVGPYGDLTQAQQTRSRLDQLGFKAIVLKVGGG